MYSPKERTKETDALFNAVLSLENLDDCYAFFQDLCTVNELGSLVQRLEVAKMLKKGITYQQIAEETGVSTATISRVNRSLNYGNGGYDKVLKIED